MPLESCAFFKLLFLVLKLVVPEAWKRRRRRRAARLSRRGEFTGESHGSQAVEGMETPPSPSSPDLGPGKDGF